MAAETLATFRISKEKWQRFQEMAKDLVLKKLKVGRQSSVGKAIDAFIKELGRDD